MSAHLRTFRKFLVYIFAATGFTLIAGYVATLTGLTNTKGIVDIQRDQFLQTDKLEDSSYQTFPLAHSPEWVAFRIAVAKDKAIIEDISKKTGVPARLLVAILVPEQMRLFYSNRELFKEIFSPLKILGSQSQFSWGIFGIKDDTARAVESHLINPSSPFYPGKQYEKMLAFKTAEPDQERFERIVDEHDHYYSYLYTALYIQQIQTQWKKAGTPIDKKPDIIATLWNLGFTKSKPHPNPQSGGAEMNINGSSYSFGKLAWDFYYSDELVELFPAQ
jgi:hypothetical protein